ncbi:MAG TPA: nickel pincer cofactor biosynthesis protein LarC [Candidatus Limnocylindrales bacterium]|nr:nickel pincer cofactor biosynthesis protein LarC [Candidatus Limnocylindrales bacterium]
MKIAYFDCFSGVSGNMILGALLDAGLPLEELQAELKKLPFSGYQISVKKVQKLGLSGTHVEVKAEENPEHRHLSDILEILNRSTLAPFLKDRAGQIFQRIAQVEAEIHRMPVEEVHFHEIGAVDSMVDIVGAVCGLYRLGIEKIYVSRFTLGRGFVDCAHGRIPLPAPATLALLKGKPVFFSDIEGELVTPTGAAILTTLGSEFGNPPAMTLQAIGYGAGTKDFPIPNVLRLCIGELQEQKVPEGPEERSQERVVVIETNIDDMNPQFYEYVMDQLFKAGALDVYLTPVLMKKSRPGTLLTVICTPSLLPEISTLILRETTTLGIRWQEMERMKAERELVDWNTPYGKVKVKVARWNGRIISATPEYEDCKKIAEVHKEKSLKEIYNEISYTILQKKGDGLE